MKKTIAAVLLLILSSWANSKENSYAQNAETLGYVNVKTMIPGIIIELKYATTDNFLGKNVYGDFRDCYLQKKTALLLKKAYELLRSKNPDCTFIVYDGVRPVSVQRQMWEIVKNTPQQGYVANPASGSLHNYGTAIDLTVGRFDGKKVTPLDMGTPFDYFGDEAQPRYEQKFLSSGKLSATHIKNRRILRDAMTQAGFTMISNEWWHFQSHTLREAKKEFTPFP